MCRNQWVFISQPKSNLSCELKLHLRNSHILLYLNLVCLLHATTSSLALPNPLHHQYVICDHLSVLLLLPKYTQLIFHDPHKSSLHHFHKFLLVMYNLQWAYHLLSHYFRIRIAEVEARAEEAFIATFTFLKLKLLRVFIEINFNEKQYPRSFVCWNYVSITFSLYCWKQGFELIKDSIKLYFEMFLWFKVVGIFHYFTSFVKLSYLSYWKKY